MRIDFGEKFRWSSRYSAPMVSLTAGRRSFKSFTLPCRPVSYTRSHSGRSFANLMQAEYWTRAS